MTNNNTGQLMGVNIVVTHKNGKPAIELRALTTNPFLIKTLLGCGYRNVPVVVMPKFSNMIAPLNSAVEKGILVREGEQYFFTSDFENLI
jgi:hypothetical protein